MFHCLPNSAWADGNLADAAGQLGQMVEHRNQSQPNPGIQAHGRPCSDGDREDRASVKSAKTHGEESAENEPRILPVIFCVSKIDHDWEAQPSKFGKSIRARL